jgi:hypothetical protein
MWAHNTDLGNLQAEKACRPLRAIVVLVNRLWFPCTMFVSLSLSACAPLENYHPPLYKEKDNSYQTCDKEESQTGCGYHVCKSSDPGCEKSALQEYEEDDYTLGFIEFDDQGLLHDREQMEAVVREIKNEAKENDLLIVVFMHGWQHNAAPKDSNLKTFKEVLKLLSESEQYVSIEANKPAREVFGVYLGWRGKSVRLPGVWPLTFWDRKSTAEKVGHVGLTEVLARLERIRNEVNESPGRSTRLAVIGHSFGGAAIYAAVSQILQSRLVNGLVPPHENASQETISVGGFGNLVILINPAFEALQFTPISDLSFEHDNYARFQLPVLAILTSEADGATENWFRYGRWISTFFDRQNEDETERDNATTDKTEVIDQDEANITAVGHFEDYRTHRLCPALMMSDQDKANTNTVDHFEPDSEDQLCPSRKEAAPEAPNVFDVCGAWANDQKCGEIHFKDTVLTRTCDSAERNPYLVVRVDETLLKDHSTLYDRDDPNDPQDSHNLGFIEFIKQLIIVSSKLPEKQDEQADVSQQFGELCNS